MNSHYFSDKEWDATKIYVLLNCKEIQQFIPFLSYAYEPFVLAEQAQQVYFAKYPSKRKDSIDWWAVCKIKARNQIDSPNIPYQEDANLPPIIPNITDDLDSLRHENGKLEIHEVKNETDEIDQEHDINAIESDEEIEEFDFELSEDEGDEQRNMTRGRGIKRSWGGRGGITNKAGGGSKLTPDTSQKDVSESSIPTSQQVGLNHCIVSSHETSVHTSQEANAQQITTLENVGGQQEAPTSLDVG
ncbi:hypothetical protein RDI58_007412 [Solanum bulbocastanum]|uniref:DUF4216 domain-containing protein n=1 Tax=Solanum bulbocastanum TaxID=147425 RepID=A0AAN8YHP0_SOLBU